MEQQQVINLLKDGAIECQKKYGILASLTLAQGILESGWIKSGLALNHCNLFGIKAGSSWQGQKISMPTQEWDGSKYITIDAYFRKYNSYAESIEDHALLFVNNQSRYGNLIGETNYREACRKVREDGYATSPTYTDNLIRLIEQYNLNQWDNVQTEPTPAPQPTENIYVVQSGDTLSGIARKFGISSYMTIANANGISNPNIISVGQRLVIPTSTPTPQPIPAVDTNKYGIVTASVLNVRSGRGTQYGVIGQLKNGEKVRLDQLMGDWWSIYFGDHGGFVHKNYIQQV